MGSKRRRVLRGNRRTAALEVRQESGRSQRGWISERAGIIDVQTVAGLELAAVSSAKIESLKSP